MEDEAKTLNGSSCWNETDDPSPRPRVECGRSLLAGAPRRPMTARMLAVLSAGLMYGSVSQRRRPPSCAWYHILHASHCFSHERQITPSSSCARQQRSHVGIEGAGEGVAMVGNERGLLSRVGVVASTYLNNVIGERGRKTGDCAICGVGRVSMSDGTARRPGEASVIGKAGTEA